MSKRYAFLKQIMAIDILTYNAVPTPDMTAVFLTMAKNAW